MAPPASSSLRGLALIYLGAATLGLAGSLLPHAHSVHGPMRWAMIGAAYALGTVLWIGRSRLPGVAVDAALAAGVGLVTLGLALNGPKSPQYSQIWYVWSALSAAYLLPPRRAGVQLGFIGAAYGGYLVSADIALKVAFHTWLMTVGTAGLATVLVGLLKQRVQRLIEHVAETAKRDPRTGLLNGSGFEEVLDRELERAQRAGGSLSVIIVDLDRFKDVNDEFGHRVADERLATVGAMLERTKRRIDIVARVSGQEFALLLPETDEHGAYVLADRLRRAIRDYFADDALATTASLGVASFPKHGSTFEELFGAASQAVYAAKELGRDRSVIYNPEITANLRSAAMRQDMQSEEHLAAVLVLAETLDMRDTGTARHSETVGRYAKLIAAEMGMTPRETERVHLAGMLHDIGKIGISDTILQKPGKLTEAEWDEMRKHPELGARILDGARLEDISTWVRSHHERPDGRGYPEGLADERIPIQAKILAVADSYEAMTAERVYKPGMPHEAAREELLRCAGSQFDPAVVLAFISVLTQAQSAAETAASAA
jgi:diguanylate cyclase (GGDEF)-like protein/putative nucleotidyltransferase with HDIG domain